MTGDQLVELREAVQAAVDALATVADKLAVPPARQTDRATAVAMTLAALGRLEDRGFLAHPRRGSIDALEPNSLDFHLARYLCEART